MAGFYQIGGDGANHEDGFKTFPDQDVERDRGESLAVYPVKLVETQDVGKVDAISGATVSHGQFVHAVKKALEKAR